MRERGAQLSVQVTVKLHGILRDYRPAGMTGDVMQLDFDDSATVISVVERIGIPRKVIHAAFLNDEQVRLDTALKDGGFLRLFPPVVGGCSPRPVTPPRHRMLCSRRGVAKPGRR